MADKELETITTPNFNDEIEDAVAKKHTQGTDQKLDEGGANEVAVADVKDAVDKKHSQNTDTELAPLTADIDLNAHKILEFATPVTVKTTTDTLTVAEAGLIKVSAASAYTLTLPTAVGHTGLTYHFVKTDANYNLITLDANGTETFNFPNDDGVPKQTYTRLNTYCAEVTVVSDGTNWQCINEKLGQVPMALVYRTSGLDDVPNSLAFYIPYDAKDYDIGNNYDMSNWVSGNATSTLANHLIDSGGAFTSNMVGFRVKNTTDSTYTYVTAYNSATDLTVRDDIFVDTEGYEIKNSKFIVPIPGKYNIQAKLTFFHNIVADKAYVMGIKVNRIEKIGDGRHASFNGTVYTQGNGTLLLSTNDEVEVIGYHAAGVETIDTASGVNNMYNLIRLLSKT